MEAINEQLLTPLTEETRTIKIAKGVTLEVMGTEPKAAPSHQEYSDNTKLISIFRAEGEKCKCK